MTDTAKRVGNGADLLDRDQPGWPARVNPAALDMTHGRRDILGLVYGDYMIGLDALFDGDERAAMEHGMAGDDPDELRAAWLAEINRRIT